MAQEPIKVCMLGEFSLQNGSVGVNDGDNRTKKVWLLLAYMIYCRGRTTTPDELVELLWGSEGGSINPLNALKTMFHRVRATLDPLGERAGHTLILRREGSYVWNSDIPVELDIDEFDRLCKAGANARSEEKRIEKWMEAAALYRGDFLAKLSNEIWVVPIAAYYHNLYVDTVLSTLPLLEARSRWEDMEALCRAALVHEPYSEEFYRYLMVSLIWQDRQRSAAEVYEQMSELLLARFGIMPSDTMRALYREALRSKNDNTVAPGVILEQLREEENGAGALFCDYDIFKSIYHSFARAVARSGDAVHLALISIECQGGGDLPRRSLDRVVDNLKELIRKNLRRGDIAARCSVSQFILLLPQANYENSCMVCERIIKTFNRQYPHSPATLRSSVHPLEPNP